MGRWAGMLRSLASKRPGSEGARRRLERASSGPIVPVLVFFSGSTSGIGMPVSSPPFRGQASAKCPAQVSCGRWAYHTYWTIESHPFSVAQMFDSVKRGGRMGQGWYLQAEEARSDWLVIPGE